VEVAWQTACHEAGPQDLVLACGSLFVVGEVLALYAWKEGEPVV
jgi:folylpolyglutamate synthase/dihydropteroate synthase